MVDEEQLSRGQIYYRKNKNKISDKSKIYRWKNKEKISKRGSLYYNKNKEKISKYYKTWREENLKDYNIKNKEKIKEQQREYYERNKKEIKKRKREKYKMNKKPITGEQRAWNKKYFGEKYRNDKQFNIRVRLCNNFRMAIKAYNEEDRFIICRNKNIDYKAIIEHLKPFPKDIRDYHIDHIIPLRAFDLTDKEQLRNAWNPINFQWLKSGDNESKHATVDFDRYPEQEAVFNKLALPKPL